MTRRLMFALALAAALTFLFGGFGPGVVARQRPGVHVTPKGYRTPVYGMASMRDAAGRYAMACARLASRQIDTLRLSRAVSRSMVARSPRSTVQAVAGGAFEIIYTDAPGTGFFDTRSGAARRRALEASLTAWALVLDTIEPIVIQARMEPDEGEGLLASAGPIDFIEIDDMAVPFALASQWFGEPVGEGEGDIEVVFNEDEDWDYATNGVAARGKPSFVYVTIHEIGHGLGFLDSFDPDEGETLNGAPFVFDVFINRGSSALNLLVERPAQRVRADLISDDLFFAGENAVAASRRSIRPLPMVKLYAPDPYESGSSVSHVDQDTYADFKVGLMTPYDFGSGIDKIDILTLGVLADIGYDLVPNAVTAGLPISARPSTPTSALSGPAGRKSLRR